MELDTSHYADESKPVFHGMVLGFDNGGVLLLKDHILKLFRDAWMPLDMYANKCRYNKAGEFTFLNLLEERRSIEEILNGRLYDIFIVLVKDDIEIQSDMINSLLSCLKDGNKERIVLVKIKQDILEENIDSR